MSFNKDPIYRVSKNQDETVPGYLSFRAIRSPPMDLITHDLKGPLTFTLGSPFLWVGFFPQLFFFEKNIPRLCIGVKVPKNM